MAATVTLTQTTLLAPCGANDTAVTLSSTSGVLPGVRLFMDRELLTVVNVGIGTTVNVLRGVDGTASAPHAGASVVTIGRGDQFYDSDPVGMPPASPAVSPWINIRTGVNWLAQGDEDGPGVNARFWQAIVNTPSAGALGVRATTQSPTS